jgi:hypothetical protein
MPSSTTKPWYLTDMTEALYLDDSGEVAIRTGIIGNINIANVTIPGEILANVDHLGNIDISNTYMPIEGNVVVSSGNIEVTQGTDPWVIEGNVVVSSGNIEVTQGTDPWVIEGNVNATLTGDPTVEVTGLNLDAFARLRVSNPFTFFDSALSGERRYDWSSATAVTGGTELESGYISSRETSSLRLNNIYGQLSRTIAGVSDTFTLAMTATSNNADVLAQIGWQEII